ncbi:nucleotide exchange factor GrpE [Nonomuraea lactucae]|uniref:nucleotide exchange factor GrpE n=1 Tax=Nonomuraea lactucae TaxID=2249762 RepID=UPI000DE1B3B6|nr:nucleotide exchange factor GrpE [Nonomuraea lactucae]
MTIPPTDPDTPGEHPGITPLTSALDRIAEEMKREHDRAAHREEIIDRLHRDNQELRHGLLQEALIPVRAGLYRLYDLATREAARLAGGTGDSAHFRALLQAIAGEVGEVLARTGAERLETAPGDPYDQALHRPVTTVPGTPGTVVAVIADGFRLGDRILRKAEVAVGRPEQAPQVPQAPHAPRPPQAGPTTHETEER